MVDYITITVLEELNQAPIADAGENIERDVLATSSVFLEGV